MRVRSRHARRSDEPAGQAEQIPVPQAELLSADSHFRDIANGFCGSVRVSCWPSREDGEKGRLWGKVGSTKAGIMPFRTRAVLTAASVKLSTFDLELFMCKAECQGSGPASFPESCQGKKCSHHHSVCLMDLPAPKHVMQCSPIYDQADTTVSKLWRFRSEEIPNCDGLARGARWTWDANGHDPLVLHGGIALQHLGEPFVVACRVRGKAFVESPDQRFRLHFQFSSEDNIPKWWMVVPQDSSQDLTQSVQRLEAEVHELNTMSDRKSSEATTAISSHSQGHGFGSSQIGGSANVIMGNAIFGVGSGQGQPIANMQYDPRFAMSSMTQSMGQMMGRPSQGYA